MLVAHANGFHGRVYAPLAAELSDFRHLAFDFRGHGDSSTSDDLTYDWERFADDVLAVVDALEASLGAMPDDAGWLRGFGHSLGGAALLLAEERRPGTFASLFVYEPIVFPHDRAPEQINRALVRGAKRRRESFESFDAALANFAFKAPLDVLAPEALRAYVEHGFAENGDGSVAIKCPGAIEARIYALAPHRATFDGLTGVSCPVSVGCGADLGHGPSAFAPAIVERLPRGSLVRFRGLGHFGPLEDPARVATAARTALLAVA
ncbi:alpha/beta hydrolase [soil metagenome]